ncbi:MAG TPA: GDP-mannose 4,6-dehydratase [Pirellulales bacterium]|nr:GDP-mannose 4,6-dehydratase [Pirellulales bacterium]
MQRIAVIGSNSFSGSDFIDLLLESPDRQVLGISRSPEKSRLFLPYQRWSDGRFEFRQLDLNHHADEILAELDRFEPDAIVNFAAQSEVAPSWQHPEHWFQTNVVALARLLNALKDRPYLKKYVHISSPEVYGTCAGRVTEETPVNPSTPYAASKAAADLFLSTLVKNYHFPLVTIRATNVYGAHQQLWKIIPRSVIYLLTNREISLDGGGTAVKSYIHIRDVSRGELLALERGQPGTMYHLSPDGGYAVRDVVERICGLLGRSFAESAVTVGERPGQDAAYVIDSNRARQKLGWRPQVDLDQGLREVVGWVKENFAEISTQPLEYRHAA